MIQLRRRPREYEPERERPSYEVETMKAIREALTAAGYFATDGDIEQAWLDYSDSMCAGWMDHRDRDLVAIVLETMEPDPTYSDEPDRLRDEVMDLERRHRVKIVVKPPDPDSGEQK